MFSCIDRLLSKWFYHVGLCIARHPGYFIIIPLFVSLILVTGIQRMHYEDDPEYLFSPSDGRSRFERSVVDRHFPMNYSRNFDAGRITHKGRFGRIILTATDNQSVLRPEIFALAVQFDKAIREFRIEWDGDSYAYDQLCARTGDHSPTPIPSYDDEEPEVDTLSPQFGAGTPATSVVDAGGNSTESIVDDEAADDSSDDPDESAQTQYPRRQSRCYANDVLDLGAYLEHMATGQIRPSYPTWLNERTLKAYYFPSHLGGVITDSNNTLRTAEALSLIYFLDVSAKHAQERAEVWEQRFLQFVQELQESSPQVHVARFVSSTLKDELERNTHTLVPFFSVTVLIMIGFSVATCASSDWVRSKPWLGMLGCVSAGLAVAASFGACMYAGVPMIGINLAAPFLMLGVGMDDAFVLLAAWRRTSSSGSVTQRLAETYSEAAVSITITSITNFISFLIGTITPFPSVRIFCIYTAVAVLFTYMYHITFFGGWMVIFGHIERKNLHALICVPVIPKSLATGKGCCFQGLCTGGINPHDPSNRRDNREHVLMLFFRDKLGRALARTSVKVLILFGFLVYLLIGVYGCTQVREGLDRRKLSRDDSYSVEFYDVEDRNFREYPHRIQVVFNQTLDYADEAVQQQVEQVLHSFEQSEFIGPPSLTESWLRAYLRFLRRDESAYFLSGYNMSRTEDFYSALRDVFLQFPLAAHFRSDIDWDASGRRIRASRHVIQSINIPDANAEKNMLIKLRQIADSAPVKVTIFHQLFIFFDQFILVREISLQTITMAAFVMMVISLLFIPSAACAFWVAFSIVSIEIGVIGYMSLWSVNLDTISMINLIMCIGFSVDFSAHICYAYISSDLPTPAERVQAALYSLGLPIFQGSFSTILGIIALAFAPSYIFLTFFKTVFLVMLFGALHGVLLLPVLLSLSDWCCGSKTKKPQVMPPPGMFHPFADGQFTMGVGPPFSKFPRPPVLPYPPLAMGGPAFGAIPLSATAPYAYQQNKNGKLKSKVDQQIMSEAARFAFYRSQFAFLPVGPEVAPYAMGPAFAGMQNPNMLHVQSGKHERNKQFKHAKLVPSNESSESCSLHGHDIGLGTSGEDGSEGSTWSVSKGQNRPIQSEIEVPRTGNVGGKPQATDDEIRTTEEQASCSCNHPSRHPHNVVKGHPVGKVNYAYTSETEEETFDVSGNHWNHQPIWTQMHQISPLMHPIEGQAYRLRKVPFKGHSINPEVTRDKREHKRQQKNKLNETKRYNELGSPSSSAQNDQAGPSRQLFY